MTSHEAFDGERDLRSELLPLPLYPMFYCRTKEEYMVRRFLEKTCFDSYEDFMQHYGRSGTTVSCSPDGQGGHLLGCDEEGEIVINIAEGRPIGLFKEYYRNPQLTASAVRDG